MMIWILLLVLAGEATGRLARQRYFRLPDVELSESVTKREEDESQKVAALFEENDFWDRILQETSSSFPLELSATNAPTTRPTSTPTKSPSPPPVEVDADIDEDFCIKDGSGKGKKGGRGMGKKDGIGKGKKDGSGKGKKASMAKKSASPHEGKKGSVPDGDYCGKAGKKSFSPVGGKKETINPSQSSKAGSKAGGKKTTLATTNAPNGIEELDLGHDFISSGANDDHHSSGSNDVPFSNGKKTKNPGYGYNVSGKKVAFPTFLVKKTETPSTRGIPDLRSSPVLTKSQSKSPKTKSISGQPNVKGSLDLDEP
mmetsp:Transcript_1134/g.3126  ORF Transcript_1134/g.3126 Transcript_1134/m.3126 type:complete len:313 (-) Transcript_1134:107-1045(-)